MKYLRTFEDINENEINVGDYITINNHYYNDTLEIINCLKVSSLPFYKYHSDSEKMILVEIMRLDGECVKSYIYLSQIGGFASDDDIENFEILEKSRKYNL